MPVRNRLDLTQQLVEQLRAQDGYLTVFVVDNGSTDGTAEWLTGEERCGDLVRLDGAGRTLHQMWNDGIRAARAQHPVCNIALLNNDLRLGPSFCSQLAAVLRSDASLYAVSPSYDERPIGRVRYVESTFKNGGLAGFAFMVRGEVFDDITFDEDLHWWYGDDDL